MCLSEIERGGRTRKGWMGREEPERRRWRRRSKERKIKGKGKSSVK